MRHLSIHLSLECSFPHWQTDWQNHSGDVVPPKRWDNIPSAIRPSNGCYLTNCMKSHVLRLSSQPSFFRWRSLRPNLTWNGTWGFEGPTRRPCDDGQRPGQNRQANMHQLVLLGQLEFVPTKLGWISCCISLYMCHMSHLSSGTGLQAVYIYYIQ